MGTETYTYRYPHPAMTADCVIFGFDGEQMKVLLIERGLEPYKGMWALPGGFMRINETIEEAACRELFEETGLKDVFMEQFKVFSTVDRDPRERVVTVAFIALVRPADYHLVAGDDAANALWFDHNMLPPMAFDHAEIIKQARNHLSEVLRIKPLAFELLNKVFSISELQRVYEAISGVHYDRRNFHRKAMQSGLLVEIPTRAANDYEISRNSGMAKTSVAESVCNSTKIIGLSKKADAPGQPGRRATKLYTLKSIIKNSDSESDDEASTRDLFDF